MNSDVIPTLLTMRNIHVAYGPVKALKGVDFDLRGGEIHALVGEHRAGKSSLVKILSGAERRKQGEIILGGKSLGHLTPKAAAALKIGMVYQHSTVIPDLNAIDNMFVGQTSRELSSGRTKYARRNAAQAVLDRIGFSVDFDAPLFRMTAIEQHMVEFARTLVMNPTILILDELSNKLTPDEMKKVYRVVLELREEGKSIIYISHDFDEVLMLADRVTILKNGYRRETVSVRNLDRFRLFQMTYSYTLNQEKLEYAQDRMTLIRGYIEGIVQNLPVGVILVDPDGNVQLINYAAVEILECKRKPLLFQPVDSLLPFDAEYVAEILEILKRKSARVWEEIEIGEGKLVRLTVTPFLDGDKNYLGSTIGMQDISLSRHLSDYLIQSEKMASVAEVAVGVAHEINNPLYVIQNYVELMKEQGDRPENSERIALIEEQLDRIVKVISSLLSFSKMKTPPEHRVSARRIVDDVLILLQHSIAEKRIRVTTIFSPDNMYVKGDENKLKQVFVNLLRNSIEAVLDNGTITVSVAEMPQNGHVEFTVEDNGAGIPEEVEGRIFDPFFSTKVNKNNAGLGLSICRHILKEHDGAITFSTIPGASTTFRVRLPTGD